MPGLSFDLFTVSLNYVPMTSPLLDAVVRVVVDTSMNMPGMFEIHIYDEVRFGLFATIDSPLLAIGTPVKVMAKPQPVSNDPSLAVIPGVLIDGEITALEPRYNEDGTAVLVVRGYDKSHRLHRGRKTAVYQMMMDNAIAMAIAGKAGVPIAVTVPTPMMREYALQNNQTDMEYLREIAERNGADLYVNDLGILTMAKSGVPSGPGPLLTWKQNLIEFSPRASAAEQVNTVQVQGWDPLTKQGVVGMFGVIPPTQGGASLAVDLAAAKTRFGATAKVVIADQPVAMIPDALGRATAVASGISAAWLNADGRCLGDPGVKAGRMVTVLGVGLKFSGTYLVTSATHVYDYNGYQTTFHVDGHEPKTVTHLVGNGPKPMKVEGVVVGVVTNNMDPLSLGRVKVKFPHLGSLPPIESNWCRQATPMAGMMRGFYAIPEVNDEVLVAFEQGDINYPYIVGSLWNNMDRPPMPSASIVIGGKVTKRIFKSSSGHQIILDDTTGAENITIVDKTMANSIVIDSKPPGAINMKVTGDCTIQANGKVALTSLTQDVVIDCLNFKVSAKVNAEIKAMAQLQVEGTAGASMKTAASSIAMTGPSVNINNGALEII
jgi:phage protein D